MSPLLKTALFTVVVPGSVAVLIPLLIAGDRAPAAAVARVLALLLLALGAVVYLRSGVGLRRIVRQRHPRDHGRASMRPAGWCSTPSEWFYRSAVVVRTCYRDGACNPRCTSAVRLTSAIAGLRAILYGAPAHSVGRRRFGARFGAIRVFFSLRVHPKRV